MRQRNLVAGTDAVGRRAPFADTVERQDGRLLERAGEEGAGGVTLVMVQEQQTRLAGTAELAANTAAQVQLFLEPQRHGHPEASEATGHIRQVGLQKAFELGERLFVEGNVVQ